MADMDYFGSDYGAEAPSRFMDAARSFGVVNWAGAATSLGLTTIMAIWAIDVTFSDVSGVPVIAALETPARVAPADPGGEVAPFQGMALADITSGGPAAPAPEAVVLAPPPVELDAPALGERLVAAGEALPVIEFPDGSTTPSAVEEKVAALVLDGDTVELSSEGEEAELLLAAAETAEAEEAGPRTIAAYTGPGIAQSSRPAPRPAALRRAVVAAAPATVPTDAPARQPGTQVANAAGGTLDTQPNALEPGTRVVQLGAFDSEAIARGEWDRLQGKFGDYLAGKSRMIQKARSGGRDFWRLRAVGFADASDARRFCSALTARDAACMPVTIR